MSLIVCTFNRADSLRQTLQSLITQTVPAGSLEIIVVDNHSTDHTSSVVEQMSAQSPWPVRQVREPRQGVGYARNCGLEHAQGDYVAFIDDDAMARPGWVAALLDSFAATPADLVGGKIDPLWLTARPGWLTDDLLGPVVALDFGPFRKRCTSPREVFLTTNCALRQASVSRYGGFDSTLGRRGARWVGGEDVELCQRWLARGACLVYEPAAVVQHKVNPERVSPAFLRRWFEDIGHTQAHQSPWKWHHRLSLLPAWEWGRLAGAATRYARARWIGSHEVTRLPAELWWRFHRGFAQERWDHWRSQWTGDGARGCHFASEAQEIA